MKTAAEPTSPADQELSIPGLAAPETTAEPFPLIAKLIRSIQQKRK